MNLGIACTLGMEAAAHIKDFALRGTCRKVCVVQAVAEKRVESNMRTCV